jgi:hypothetical protein
VAVDIAGPRPGPPYVPPVEMIHLADPQPCRYCLDPTWGADDLGPMHPCCRSNAVLFEGGGTCPACEASKRIAAGRVAREKRKQRYARQDQQRRR